MGFFIPENGDLGFYTPYQLILLITTEPPDLWASYRIFAVQDFLHA